MVSYFSIILSHVQCNLIKILSTREGLFCSTNLVRPRICRVNQLLVSRSKNPFTSCFLSKFSKLIFKSPVNITFLFSLESVLRVSFNYHKNFVSFNFGCLYTTPTTNFSLLLYIISIHCASLSLKTYRSHNLFLTLSHFYLHSFGSQLVGER